MDKYIKTIVFIGRQLIRLTILNLVSIILVLIPTNKKIILFGGWRGKKYLDNAKHLFIYFNEQNDGLNTIWITKDKQLTKYISGQGHTAYYAYSLTGIIVQIRASSVIFCQSVEEDFISFLIKPYAVRVQLWHGTPIKKIGYADKFNIASKNIISIVNKIIPFYTDKLDLCIAIGDYDKQIYEEAFNVLQENVVITGYPRNDALIGLKKIEKSEHIKIIYLPTYRTDLSLLQQYIRNDILSIKVQEMLKKFKYQLYIKLHPAQDSKIGGHYGNEGVIQFIYQGSTKDIYEEIMEYDIIITDVSGVYFDILLTNKKIYTYMPDLQEYLQIERDLYYNIHEISVSKVYNDFLDLINEISLDNYNVEKHNNMKHKFHKYNDEKSCERVYREVNKKLK